MKAIEERLKALRSAMKEEGCSAYIIPSSDPHSGEYAPAHFTSWEYFTGFSCENATFIITADRAALWIDGRFFGAADAALEGTGIASMHMKEKGVPEPEDWLFETLEAGSVLGYTAENMPLEKLRKLEKRLSGKVSLKPCSCDSSAWGEDRPPLPSSEVWLLEEEFSGAGISEKLSLFREKLEEADAAVINELDSIAWLFNLRAADINCTPYALAFSYVSKTEAVLFIDFSRIPASERSCLEKNGVALESYSALPAFLAGIGEKAKILIDPETINASLFNALKGNDKLEIVEKTNPVSLLKAVKNETEIACTKKAHLNDGAAVVRFMLELEQRLAAGEALRETDIGKILLRYRSADPLFLEESFPTIAAYGANAAMMHYAPVEGRDALIERKGFLLVDCGGTYRNGTTDITRTIPCGPVTELEKKMYTLTLKSHIDMASALWKEGMKGGQLDMLARQPFWKMMLDYRCGTGHGVAHVGSVHEGPQNLRVQDETVFLPGMVITDEPGYYEEGLMGIRIENELLCVEAGESEYGKFLKFEPLTFVPIELSCVLKEELTEEEVSWLNCYHRLVYAKLSPLLEEAERKWLERACRPL